MKNCILEATIMRRFRLATLLIAMSLFHFNSCALGGARNMIMDDSDTRAKKLFEQLLELIKAGDGEAVKSLFSERALSEAEDFDDNTERLFAFFQGEVVSWEQHGFEGGISNEYGKKSENYNAWYPVTTDEDEYIFFIVMHTRNDFDPDMEGMYTLRILKAANKETQFIYNGLMEIPGIWVPEE
jgi:hypothetical protein